MSDPTFMEITAPNGEPMLLNLAQTFAITKDPAGLAVAVSSNGYPMVLGIKYEAVKEQLSEEDAGAFEPAPNTPGGRAR